ncbi:MAG: NAD-dependent deacetylase [Chloroflexota bacterium]|nr:NAD-dependent deacetylase [Chloroflexota bacterium]
MPFTPAIQQKIEKAADLLKHSHAAVAFTGAGISTPSGIPDFRSPGSGLWEHYDPFEVASLSAFKHHPERFFDWIRPLAGTARAAQPNAAHRGLAELEAAGLIRAVITQNIDNLHQKAGSQHVIELHGSAQSAHCMSCGREYGEGWLSDEMLMQDSYPHCTVCGGVIKPDVVLFEEMLPAQAWSEAQALCEQADVIFVIGSSLGVAPANYLPESGLHRGASLIINTQSDTHLDRYAEVVIQEDLNEVVPAICRLALAE